MDSGRSEDVSRCEAPSDATSDSPSDEPDSPAIDAHDDRAPDFELVLVTRPLVVAPGDTAPLLVRIDRVGGFDAPVLIDLWGLPDTVAAQPRESRVGDDVLEITIEANEDTEPVEDWAYAVQASALGIRRVERTTLSIR